VSPTKPLLLFVYGTLMRRQRNHCYLDGAHFLGQVRTAAGYTLVLLGSFPALREDGISSIPGELYSVGSSILGRLDQLEGHPDFYRRGSVQLDDGRTVTSYLLPCDQHRKAEQIACWPEPCKSV